MTATPSNFRVPHVHVQLPPTCEVTHPISVIKIDCMQIPQLYSTNADAGQRHPYLNHGEKFFLPYMMMYSQGRRQRGGHRTNYRLVPIIASI